VIRDIAMLLVSNALLLAAGAGVTHLAGIWSSPRQLPGAVGVSYVAGAAAVGVLSALGLIAGLSMVVWQILVLCGGLASLVAIPRHASAGLGHGLPTGRRAAWVARSIQVVVALYLALLFVHDALKPLLDWDSWTMWTMKAKALVMLGGLDPRLFAGQAYRGLHLDYPLLMPALEAMDFRLMGNFDTQVIHLQAWALLVGFVIAAAQMLRDRVAPVVLWPGLMLVVVAPSLEQQVASGSSDAPMALFFALAAIAGWRFVADRERFWLVLLVLYASAAAATKQEGAPFVVALLLVVVVFSHRARAALVASAIVLAGMLPWVVWLRVHHAIHTNGGIPTAKALDLSYMAGRTGRLWPAVAEMGRQALRPHSWLLILPLAVVVLALHLRKRNRRLGGFVLSVVVLVTAAVLWAYWIGKPGIHWYVTHSARRTVTTAVVCAGIFLPLLVSELVPGRDEAQPPPGPAPGGSA
jgi:hypothetical protein